MKVLLVTTWGSACGIAEHSWYLKDSVERADPGIAIEPCPEALDPFALDVSGYDVLHLNYQASLLSRYTPTAIEEIRASCRYKGHRPIPIVVTYHDTGIPNSQQCLEICDVADRFVIHETAGDLGGLDGHGNYWRMGVPAWETPRSIFGARNGRTDERAWRAIDSAAVPFKSWRDQPVLGTIGFPFPWKNYDQLATITRKVGWALLLIAPTATAEQVAGWRQRNPDLYVRTDFVPRQEAIAMLAGCDATAFMYVCHNTGQSAAILQGIAARKPVHALYTCRQFRALWEDRLGHTAISWCETFEELEFNLSHLTGLTGRPYAPMVALAEQESWEKVGRKYATLYRELERT